MIGATRGVGLGLLLLLLLACGCDARPAPNPNPTANFNPAPGGTQPDPGASPTRGPRARALTAEERQRFYHLAEGSELYPLAWLQALQTEDGSPFLEGLERFGLIPDPENPQRLPIGMTAQAPRDVRIFGEMIGINCAGCHVGQLTRAGRSVRIDGAPNLFDINSFYLALFEAAGATLRDPARLAAFLDRLRRQGGLALQRSTQAFVATLAALEQEAVEKLGPAERSFAGRLRSLVDRAEARVRDDLRAEGRRTDGRALLRSKLSEAISDRDVADLVGSLKQINPGGVLKDLAGQAQGEIKEIVLNAALLRARLNFLKRLKLLHTKEQSTAPGPGRIDAFVNARDLIFPESEIIPANSPVSYPHLWQLNQTVWLHWDGNTNSVMERNIGQSMGLGAVFDPESLTSTVLPRNLHTLERLTRTLPPPPWPADVLGPVDRARAERGRAIYAERCIRCHAILDRPDYTAPDVITPLDEIGTDPGRVENFARTVLGGKNFAEQLGATANAIKKQAYRDNGISEADQNEMDLPDARIRWRTNRGYVGRPLVAIWATAPYLHNGSVPTLDALLRPAPDRPKTFPVGHREYDPARLGYVTDVEQIPPDQRRRLYDFDPLTPGRQDFDTAAAGNHNTGHEGHDYGTDLSDEQRKDLLEYLKGP